MASQYNDKKDDMNFKDSWLQTSVELAALGAIGASAGTLAIKGDFRDATRYGKRGVTALGRGFENYVNRKGGPGAKFLLRTGKSTFNRLRGLPNSEEVNLSAYIANTNSIRRKVETDPHIQKRIREEVANRINSSNNVKKVNDALDGTDTAGRPQQDHIRYVYEQVKNEEINKLINPNSARSYNPRSSSPSPSSPAASTPAPSTKLQPLKETIVSGLSGLAFGAGITGIHGLSQLMGNGDVADKAREDAFHYSGTFKNREDDKPMNKKAGSLELYNRLGEIKKKTPEAMAAGLGYTGISLASAKALNGSDPRTKNSEDHKKDQGPRVIIELGDPTPELTSNNSGAPLANLPKFSSTLRTQGLFKNAAPAGKKGLFNNFLKDLGGHSSEIEKLKNTNSYDQAAAQLKDQDIPSLLKQNYGNLVDEKSEPQFRSRLFDSYADRAQKGIDEQIRQLETRKADARLKTGVGLAAGGGLAALAYPRKKENGNG